jgi:ketosteroid isomerase-like protein
MRTVDPLQDFCRAFAAKDEEGIVALFDPKGLCELPLIGQRLVGADEIRAGFTRAFSLVHSCSIDQLALKSSATTTIAEGRLHAKLHRDHRHMNAPLAIVVVADGGWIARLSVYLDARPFRLWCDGPILGTLVSKPPLEGRSEC